MQLNGLSGVPGSDQVYKLTVPARAGGTDNNVHVRIFNGTGNADVYVQQGSAPSLFEYECRGVKEGNSEVCNLNDVRDPGRLLHQGVRREGRLPEPLPGRHPRLRITLG